MLKNAIQPSVLQAASSSRPQIELDAVEKEGEKKSHRVMALNVFTLLHDIVAKAPEIRSNW
jgi:hypothetical protein